MRHGSSGTDSHCWHRSALARARPRQAPSLSVPPPSNWLLFPAMARVQGSSEMAPGHTGRENPFCFWSRLGLTMMPGIMAAIFQVNLGTRQFEEWMSREWENTCP